MACLKTFPNFDSRTSPDQPPAFSHRVIAHVGKQLSLFLCEAAAEAPLTSIGLFILSFFIIIHVISATRNN